MSLIVSGCVAAFAVGAAGGAGGYAWASGKLTFTTSHGISECHDATLSGFNDLKIIVVSDSTDRLSGKIKGKTQTGEAVAVDLEPQASNVTKIDVRVGFANRTQATSVADAIKRHLR
jgi:hypothetical protein